MSRTGGGEAVAIHAIAESKVTGRRDVFLEFTSHCPLPSGNQRPPKSEEDMQTSWKHPLLGAALGIVLPTIIALGSPLPGGVAPITPPFGGFGIDGDLLANSPFAGIGDWTASTNIAPGSGLSVLNA